MTYPYQSWCVLAGSCVCQETSCDLSVMMAGADSVCVNGAELRMDIAQCHADVLQVLEMVHALRSAEGRGDNSASQQSTRSVAVEACGCVVS